MTSPLVSIIIAAYNAEGTLARCLDSILSQTHDNMEVIIVNDCSTDNTQAIIDKYASKDCRIIPMMMKKNSGAPAARNKGMAISKGKYMTTIDADDAISSDAIECAVRDMEADNNVDLVIYDIININDSGVEKAFRINPKVPKLMTGSEACYWSMQWDIPGWGVTRSPLEQNMPEETTYGQYGDETTTHLVILKARKVKLGQGKYYHYHVSTSYTNNISIKRFEILECRLSLKNHLIEASVNEKIIKRLDIRRWRELIEACYLYWKYSNTAFKSQNTDILKRLKDTYSTFQFKDLPLKESLKPRFMMLPSFRLFYLQLTIIFKLGLTRMAV